jgi:hypothetical protein
LPWELLVERDASIRIPNAPGRSTLIAQRSSKNRCDYVCKA